jgi:hypothetical protein
MITAAHHRASLTERGETMRIRHDAIEARATKWWRQGPRDQVRPRRHIRTRSLMPGPHSVPACLRAFPSMSQNVPFYRITFIGDAPPRTLAHDPFPLSAKQTHRPPFPPQNPRFTPTPRKTNPPNPLSSQHTRDSECGTQNAGPETGSLLAHQGAPISSESGKTKPLVIMAVAFHASLLATGYSFKTSPPNPPAASKNPCPSLHYPSCQPTISSRT